MFTLNNDSADTLYDFLKTGRPNTEARSPHPKRLVEATARIQRHTTIERILPQTGRRLDYITAEGSRSSQP